MTRIENAPAALASPEASRRHRLDGHEAAARRSRDARVRSGAAARRGAHSGRAQSLRDAAGPSADTRLPVPRGARTVFVDSPVAVLGDKRAPGLRMAFHGDGARPSARISRL